MTGFAQQLPPATRARAASDGERGRAWIESLDQVVSELADLWSIEINTVVPGGSEALVLTVRRRADDRAGVVKIGMPASANLDREAAIYELAAGRGYAELLAFDPNRRAIMLERLGSSLRDLDLTVDAQIDALCATLKNAWINIDADAGFMTGREKAAWLSEYIEEQYGALGKPCDKRVVRRALDYAGERADAFTEAASVLVHGDAHADNALTVGADTTHCKLVDPDGLFAEKACDLAVLMRDWSDTLLAGDTSAIGRARCARMAMLTDVDDRATWQWGFVERVSTGLAVLSLASNTSPAHAAEFQDEADAMFAVAERFLSEP